MHGTTEVLDEAVTDTAAALRDDFDADGEYNAISMTTLHQTFARMQRLATELALEARTPVEFVTRGEDMVVTRSALSRVQAPLSDLLRTSMDAAIADAGDNPEVAEPTRIVLTACRVGLDTRIEFTHTSPSRFSTCTLRLS